MEQIDWRLHYCKDCGWAFMHPKQELAHPGARKIICRRSNWSGGQETHAYMDACPAFVLARDDDEEE